MQFPWDTRQLKIDDKHMCKLHTIISTMRNIMQAYAQ